MLLGNIHKDFNLEEKKDWVISMRRKFCARQVGTEDGILLEDGSLNREYFLSKTVKQTARKWSEVERQLLLKGIEIYGVGHFNEISKELLPDWVFFLIFVHLFLPNFKSTSFFAL
eukprot:Sdes_comp19746_c0_seq2m11754